MARCQRRLKALAVSGVVEVVRADFDHKLAFDADAEAMDKSGWNADLGAYRRCAGVLRQPFLIDVLVTIARLEPELVALCGSVQIAPERAGGGGIAATADHAPMERRELVDL